MNGASRVWAPRTFPVFAAGDPPIRLVHGYVERGLGLFHAGWGPRRMETRWRLIHLPSGLSVVDEMVGDVATVFPVAGAIASLTNFNAWSMAKGWMQVCPDLPELLRAVADARPDVVRMAAPEDYRSGRRHNFTEEEMQRFIAAREDFEARHGDREGWWAHEELAHG